ncbi:hypothetical protein AB0J80_13435 [Actinoplanes sp. NPDC049548]
MFGTCEESAQDLAKHDRILALGVYLVYRIDASTVPLLSSGVDG